MSYPLTETYTESTQGRTAGPLTAATALGGMVTTILAFVTTSLGIVVPPEVMAAVVGLILTGVVWFAKGRKEVQVVSVPVPTAPLQDGTGAHRAEEATSEPETDSEPAPEPQRSAVDALRDYGTEQ